MEKHLDGVPTFYAASRRHWREWLVANHATQENVWLIVYKKESGTPSVYYDEAVEEALCFGWIDSKGNKRDQQGYLQFFARRKPRSNWSQLNKTRVEKLLAQGLMTDAGLRTIEIAKQNGAWDALNEVENLVLPTDLAAALEAQPAAKGYFEAFPRSVKRGILEWILNAKKPETRQKRIVETVSLAARNIRANQFRR